MQFLNSTHLPIIGPIFYWIGPHQIWSTLDSHHSAGQWSNSFGSRWFSIVSTTTFWPIDWSQNPQAVLLTGKRIADQGLNDTETPKTF